MTPLSPPRLVVTGHDKAGKSVFLSDEPIQPFFPFGPAASSFCNFHTQLRVPVSNDSFQPRLSKQTPRCPPGGLTFDIADFQPGGRSPMHRTISQDYAVVVSGEIVCQLDGGEETTLKTGEFMVQRGVNHAWINRTDEPCRVMFVMASAQKVVLSDGTALEATMIP